MEQNDTKAPAFKRSDNVNLHFFIEIRMVRDLCENKERSHDSDSGFRVGESSIMKITTLENGDRQLELSEHERDTLIEVATYLRDHYDDLEFSIHEFSIKQVEEAINLLDSFLNEPLKLLTEENIVLLKNIMASSTYLIDESFFDTNEDLYEISSDFSILLRKNLESYKNSKEIVS